MSIFRGFLIAFSIADFVISWKTIRLVVSGFNFKTSQRCQAIASPSRSSSVASQTSSAAFTAFRSSLTTFFFPGSTSKVILYLLFVSIGRPPALFFLAIWRMCPTLDITVKSLPRYFSIVFALAGLSTITKFFISLIYFTTLNNFVQIKARTC